MVAGWAQRPLVQNRGMRLFGLRSIGTACSTAMTAALASMLFCCDAFSQVDVLTQHNDNARTGANLQEVELTPANVNKAQFGMLFKRVVDDQLYTQPLIVTGVEVNGGTHD